MLIKICGLTRAEDALLAAELGATHLGFVFAPSPRAVRPAVAGEIRRELEAAGFGKDIKTVGVFVNESAASIRSTAIEAELDLVQLHGEETPEFAFSLGIPWYKAIRPADAEQAEELAKRWSDKGWILLADAFVPGIDGGTGKRLDGEVARVVGGVARSRGAVFFLAGGITPENVRAALRDIQPDGIDVASGVESAPGIKSEEKLRALFAVLAADGGA